MSIDSALDQSLFVPELKDHLVKAAHVLDQVEQTHDLEVAVDYLSGLRAAQQISGLGMAMVLSGIKKMWDKLEVGEEFEDFILASIGLSKQTVTKYIQIWETIFENPSIDATKRNQLANKPMKGLLLLPAAIREGDLSDEDMDEIVAAPDVATMREIVRRARGQQTSSKNAIVIMLDRDGTLTAHKNGNAMINIGYFDLKLEDEVGQVAIERLIRAAGVVVR